MRQLGAKTDWHFEGINEVPMTLVFVHLTNRRTERLGRGAINTYCHDSPKGRRPKPSAEVLYLVCAVLGFSFDYKGYRISAATLNGGPRTAGKESVQLPLEFESQFDLTNEKGTVSVKVKQPPGRIEVSLSLKTAV